MRIVINLDSIHEEEEDEQPREEDAENEIGDDNDLIFSDGAALANNNPEADEDLVAFGS